jgi:hypothetical protein
MNDFQAAERKHMEEPVMDIGLEHLCALVNNNVRCYDLSKDLSENVMHSLSDYYAEQVGYSLADVIVASPSKKLQSQVVAAGKLEHVSGGGLCGCWAYTDEHNRRGHESPSVKGPLHRLFGPNILYSVSFLIQQACIDSVLRSW